ncbi:MaoC family dehydratase N-terminal domain-containing protein [Psychrobacillus sp. NPDC058041]|uniref:FAS1-like dehydratase domain-containing protein n=1 Tax=Psychrobacillus sp. NPDC058041 TaxID=3346310 RepID=UPI0036DF5F60
MNSLHEQLYVTDEWISRYAQSIESPLQTIHGKLIAPVTMPIIFWQAFDIPWLKNDAPLIHGTQQFSYKSPVIAGMTLDCELTLMKVDKKEGKQGMLTFFTHKLECKCEGNLIVAAQTVLIQVGEQYE